MSRPIIALAIVALLAATAVAPTGAAAPRASCVTAAGGTCTIPCQAGDVLTVYGRAPSGTASARIACAGVTASCAAATTCTASSIAPQGGSATCEARTASTTATCYAERADYFAERHPSTLLPPQAAPPPAPQITTLNGGRDAIEIVWRAPSGYDPLLVREYCVYRHAGASVLRLICRPAAAGTSYVDEYSGTAAYHVTARGVHPDESPASNVASASSAPGGCSNDTYYTGIFWCEFGCRPGDTLTAQGWGYWAWGRWWPNPWAKIEGECGYGECSSSSWPSCTATAGPATRYGKAICRGGSVVCRAAPV